MLSCAQASAQRLCVREFKCQPKGIVSLPILNANYVLKFFPVFVVVLSCLLVIL
jgi:hypothetical protein